MIMTDSCGYVHLVLDTNYHVHVFCFIVFINLLQMNNVFYLSLDTLHGLLITNVKPAL